MFRWRLNQTSFHSLTKSYLCYNEILFLQTKKKTHQKFLWKKNRVLILVQYEDCKRKTEVNMMGDRSSRNEMKEFHKFIYENAFPERICLMLDSN